jgi:peptide deformylase
MLNKVDNPEQNTTNNMKLKILKYPNPKLRNENEIITDFDDNLVSIASSMLSVMYTSDGVGLAAPQVGINKRLMVFNELGNILSTSGVSYVHFNHFFTYRR